MQINMFPLKYRKIFFYNEDIKNTYGKQWHNDQMDFLLNQLGMYKLANDQ